jgi:hypothetical protein
MRPDNPGVRTPAVNALHLVRKEKPAGVLMPAGVKGEVLWR